MSRIEAKFLSRGPRICKILQYLAKNSREKLTKVNANKQKPTTTATWSTYLSYRSRSRYQPIYHVLKFNTLCCPVANTSKIDNVADSESNSKVHVNKIVVCFTTLFIILILLIRLLLRFLSRLSRRGLWEASISHILSRFSRVNGNMYEYARSWQKIFCTG